MKRSIITLFLVLLFSPFIFSQNTLDNLGLSSSAPAAVAFSMRKLSSGYTGYAVKIRRSSDNAEANVSFDGSNVVSTSSNVTFTAGVTLITALGTAKTGTIGCTVAKSGTITITTNKTGTIVTALASQTVTGTNTAFLTELTPGDKLFTSANIFLGIVYSIESNTSLTLNNDACVGYGSGTAFRTTNAMVTGSGTAFSSELVAGDRIFNSAYVYLGTVATIYSNTSMTLNSRDAIAGSGLTYKGTSATVTGSGTLFTTELNIGDLLVSNNTTLGIVSSITDNTTLTLQTKAGGAISGLAYKATTGTIPFSSFFNSTSVYVNAWYDQSGNHRDIFQYKAANQPRLVNNGTLNLVNGKPSLEFATTLNSFLESVDPASWLANTLYTFNKVSQETYIGSAYQFAVSTTGGSGPINTISHYGYRSQANFTVAQYSNDVNFIVTPSLNLETQTAVRVTINSCQFYKNSTYVSSLAPSPVYMQNLGLFHLGLYTPTSSYYNGFISEVIYFPSALSTADRNTLDNNQTVAYHIPTNKWSGAQSTDWFDNRNWTNDTVPTATKPNIVSIPAGCSRYPLIAGSTPAAVNNITVESGASLTITGTLQLNGSINGICNATAGTIEFVGSVPQTIGSNYTSTTIQNLNIKTTNSSNVTMSNDLTVSGTLTFGTATGNGKLALANSALTLKGAIANSGTNIIGSSNASLIFYGNVSTTFGIDQGTPGTSNLIKTLTINSVGQVITLGSNMILNGNGALIFTTGKLALGSNLVNIRGNVTNTVNEGLRGSATSNVTVDGILSPTLSFDQTTLGTTNSLSTLTLNCTGQTVTLNRSLSLVNLSITNGILVDGGNQILGSGTLTFSSGKIKLGSSNSATTWPGFATNTISSGTTVEYASNISQSISGTPVYQNLTLSGTAGAVATGNITVNGILSLSVANPSATTGLLSMGNYTLNMGALATTNGPGDVTGIVKRNSFTPNTTYTFGNQFTTLTISSGGTMPTDLSIKITLGTAPSWKTSAAKRVYDIVRTGGSNTTVTLDLHYLDTELQANAESDLVIWDYHSTQIPPVVEEHGKANQSSIDNWVGISNRSITYFATAFNDHLWFLSKKEAPTFLWQGTPSNDWYDPNNWAGGIVPSDTSNVVIPDSTTTIHKAIFPSNPSANVKTITIQNKGVLYGGSRTTFTIKGSTGAWLNLGTFYPGTSTVVFTNANATMADPTNFYNLTIATGAALTPGTSNIMRIAGKLTNNGTLRAALLPNTIEFNGDTAQAIINPNGLTAGYYNIAFSGSGVKTLPTTLNVTGNFTNNGTISSGGTVIFNGSAVQNISGSSTTVFNNVNISNTIASVQLSSNMSVNGSLSIDTLAVLKPSPAIIINGSGTLSGKGSVIVSRNAVVADFNSQYTIANKTLTNLVVDYAGDSTQIISPITFGNLSVDNLKGVLLQGNSTIGNSLSINKGSFTIEAGKFLTVNGNLVNNAGNTGLVIKSDANGTGSLINNSANVSATVERYIPTYDQYHYISSPVMAAKSEVYHYAWLYFWNELIQYWTNIPNIYYPLTPMKGFNLLLKNVSGNPDAEPNNPVIYTGILNSGAYGADNNITNTDGNDASIEGYNLVGNPYPSAIDWDATSGWTKTNVNNAIYIWKGSQYASYVNGYSTNGGTSYIAPMQGFFVRRTQTSFAPGTLKMNNNVRVHNTIAFNKSLPKNVLSLRLEGNALSDETIIRFTPFATEVYDSDNDAYKMFGYEEVPQLYTQTTDGSLLSINSLPNLVTDVTVPLLLKVGSKGYYSISASEINSFTQNVSIFLEDHKDNNTILLNDNPIYTFFAEPGDTTNRFTVRFSINYNQVINNQENYAYVYSSGNDVFIRTNFADTKNGLFEVFNITGQLIARKHLENNTLNQTHLQVSPGCYMVRITMNSFSKTEKIIIH